MIESLYIKNYALIDELEVHFGEGLNILTGQTGAGKSIILGALNMILGERADTTVIRRGADKAIAEGSMYAGENEIIKHILEENAVEYQQHLLLRREIRDSGSRAFINDTPVRISVLKKVGNYLVDLHGQHDHQLLLKQENHRGLADTFGEIHEVLADYQQVYGKFTSLKQELKSLQKEEKTFKEKRELHRFQLRELQEANLKEGEESELEAEMKLLDNAEELEQKAAEITSLGADDEASVISFLNMIKLHLEDMAHIEPEFENYLEEVSSARISIREMINYVERYRAGIEFNPQRLEKLRKRQNELNRLQKKYTRSVPELIVYLQQIKNEISEAESFELKIENLEVKINRQADVLAKAARKLHQERRKVGDQLSTAVEKELKNLAIRYARFVVRVDWRKAENGIVKIDGLPVHCTEHGGDDVQFYISTNKGEEPKPLAQIASGGEISRVMLALKSTLAKQQSLPVMIFDEIDAGISGKVSEKVGRSMRELSAHCQIIAITHQPQIASQAHHHYKVQKTEQGERTVTHINPLSNTEHAREVASLMSGEEITDAAMKSARQLIDKNTFKN